MANNISEYQHKSGRLLKEDSSSVNVADIMDDVYDSVNGVLKTSATVNLNASDIEIGAVEVKNSTTDDRMKVNADGSIECNAKVADGADITLGAKADATQTDETQPASLISITKGKLNIVKAIKALLPTALTGSGNLKTAVVEALPAGTNHVGKHGYTLKKVSANFTRPSNGDAYAVGDAVTNSTSAPVVFQLDLGALGAVNGQSIEIRKLVVASSVKQATLPLFNAFLSPVTFTATNDNAVLDIDDTTMNNGGAWVTLDEQNSTSSNSRVAKSNLNCPFILDAADTKIYGTLQAANAYTPVTGEIFYIVAWVALL